MRYRLAGCLLLVAAGIGFLVSTQGIAQEKKPLPVRSKIAAPSCCGGCGKSNGVLLKALSKVLDRLPSMGRYQLREHNKDGSVVFDTTTGTIYAVRTGEGLKVTNAVKGQVTLRALEEENERAGGIIRRQ